LSRLYFLRNFMATRRDDPFAGMPWLRKDLSPGRDRWDDNSLLVQTIDEMKASMGADNAYNVLIGVGTAIAAAAAKTGSQINAHDPTLLAQILASLSPAERKAIAAGDSGAVRGKVDALIEHQAQLNAQAKRAANLHGPASDKPVKAGGPEAGQWIGGKWYSAEALRNGEGRTARDTSNRFAELTASGVRSGVPASVIADYTRQYSGMGVNPAAVATFAAAGLDRGTYDGLRREGFNRQQIVRGAQDTKLLGGHGREDNEITTRASTEAREAVKAHKAAQEALKNAKTDAERAKAQAELDAAAKRVESHRKKIDALPDADPRKQNDKKFFDRYHNKQGHYQHELRAGTAIAAAATRSTAAVVASNDRSDNTAAKERAENKEIATTRTAVQQAAIEDDLLGPGTPRTPSPQPASPTRQADNAQTADPKQQIQGKTEKPKSQFAQAAAPKPAT
jgi:hypothetical protein